MRLIILKHSKQCMPCSPNFSKTLQREILLTKTSDFLIPIIILKSFDSMFLNIRMLSLGRTAFHLGCNLRPYHINPTKHQGRCIFQKGGGGIIFSLKYSKPITAKKL